MKTGPAQERRGLSWWLGCKESTCQCRRRRFDPWVGKIPWRREWQPTRDADWEIPWTEEPGRLQCTGSQGVGQNRVTNTFFLLSILGRATEGEIRRGGLLSPGDTCSWQTGVPRLFYRQDSAVPGPARSELDSIIKTLWVCVLQEKSLDNITYTILSILYWLS